MKNPSVFGSFYFKRTQSGNLLGEFTNNTIDFNTSESADTINYSENFIGQYRSSWIEESVTFQAILTISHKVNSRNKFLLKWEGDNFAFWGEGFIVDDILLGHYSDMHL